MVQRTPANSKSQPGLQEIVLHAAEPLLESILGQSVEPCDDDYKHILADLKNAASPLRNQPWSFLTAYAIVLVLVPKLLPVADADDVSEIAERIAKVVMDYPATHRRIRHLWDHLIES